MDILDPILRGPLFSCTLLGALCAIMGCIIVLKRESLIGETIAHSCYPGAVIWAFFLGGLHNGFSFAFLGCAIISALFGLWCVRWLVSRKKTSQDAALSAVLSSSMAFAFLFISGAQVLDPALWKKAQSLLLGQAATMGDTYIFLAILLSLFLIPSLFMFRRNLITFLFDADFAKMTFSGTVWMEAVFLVLLVFLVVCGIRAMGAILISALLIFPAISARYITKSFPGMIFGAACIGGISSFLGVVASDMLAFSPHMLHNHISQIPTGSCIVLFLVGFFTLSLLFSPKEGIILKAIYRYVFYLRCEQENLIKRVWKECFATKKNMITKERLRELWPLPALVEWISCKALLKKNYICLRGSGIELTPLGLLYGRKLVRLHRLWELYLVEFCGVPKERVHPSAEEMEHRITPEIERELASLLHDPSLDPHKQPIPSSVEALLHS
jgi:manganese/zinc/iron transport system permease protein